MEDQAARFIANPVGNTSTATGTGPIVSAEDGQSTYVFNIITTDETVDLAQTGALSAYDNVGNDNRIDTNQTLSTRDTEYDYLYGGSRKDVKILAV